jgi:hypothetical protein
MVRDTPLDDVSPTQIDVLLNARLPDPNCTQAAAGTSAPQ